MALQLTNQISHTENRNVNQFNLNKNKNKNKNKRGNDNRNPKGTTQGDPNVGVTPELNVYPPQLWKELSKENQVKVKALYNASKGRNIPQGNNNNPQMRG